MIGYITLGTNDFDRSVKFYDELMSHLGEKRLWKSDSMAAWGSSRDVPALCITKPFDGKNATVGNGGMVALKVSTKEQVDSAHLKAINLGGTNEGSPGNRGSNGFYGGYFRDLDGNKLNVFIPASNA
ncbi:VOC family protein [Microbulbifer sp. OS29]|uniref:VOC family protein n=1 Tax=Microbulbifer okhotskensis TaxID=2926617 RepID=A0A9X2J740_9GAMM|nr:VOC family protein [Microbulbifer okhotskensis]MCO1335385.1 VOC family protein [Microbulbifer okhotskensis]